MATFTLSLELSSLRFVEFLRGDNGLEILREEKHFFSQGTTHPKIFIQEVKETLQKIKKSWDLSQEPLHCILSSDFGLLRVATFKKSSPLTSTKKLVQRDAEQFLPLPLQQVSIAYQKLKVKNHDDSKTIAYAAIKTDFLESLVEAIQAAGFKIQKISLRPLSLCSLAVSEKTLLIDFAERSINFLTLSSQNNLSWVHLCPLSNFNKNFCEQTTGLPLLLFTYLKKELRPFIEIQKFSEPCWIIKAYFSENKSAFLALFLKKEFGISSVEIDPDLLLPLTFKDSFQFSRYHITSIQKFTAPSLIQVRRKQQILSLVYVLAFLSLLISPSSIFYDYLENKKTDQKSHKISGRLEQRQLELNELLQKEKRLVDSGELEEKLKEFQTTHDRWPLLINELQQCIPQHGIWITQLTPATTEVKGKSKITALEIKGLYLEGINGEVLVHEYASKLSTSSLFISPKNDSPFLSCSKENGTAYAYSFTLQLQLRSPIQL